MKYGLKKKFFNYFYRSIPVECLVLPWLIAEIDRLDFFGIYSLKNIYHYFSNFLKYSWNIAIYVRLTIGLKIAFFVCIIRRLFEAVWSIHFYFKTNLAFFIWLCIIDENNVHTLTSDSSSSMNTLYRHTRFEMNNRNLRYYLLSWFVLPK